MTGAPRVLVLGGGMAGLAAAWRLSEPGWRERFSSITMLERSFRLGGKGASSRGEHGRVEEHGLHVWLGHYDNAFRVMRECYAELDRERTDPSCPIRTWRDAFLPTGALGLFDHDPDGWVPWVARFSTNRLLPGEPDADGRAPSVAELLVRSALLLRDFYVSLEPGRPRVPPVTLSLSPSPPPAPGAASRALAPTLLAASEQLLLLARQGGRRLAGPGGAAAIDRAFAPLLAGLTPTVGTDRRARRLHDLVDLVRSVLVGMAVDGLRGDRDAYDAINHLDFRDWLGRHGAQPSTLQSAIVRGQYDLVFSHERGDPARPRFAAGWGVFLSSKLWFHYKGAIFWKLRSGMGEAVFAPIYQALAARGVQFRFFAEVRELVPSADGSSIRSVVVGRRAVLAPGLDRYRPLVTVKGLPCFPSRPDGGQLAAGPSPPGGGDQQALHRGEDFDLLVFAIPPAAGREVCRQLAAQRRDWRDMLDRVGTVATHAFQVWLRPDERSLGWAHPGTTMSAFTKPFETWASMSHLVELEDWRAVEPPATVGYFCSTLATTGPAAEADAAGYTRAQAIRFLERHSRHFWPNAVDPATGGFRWDYLCADTDVAGPDRFDTQYWTANTDASDRYVQALPGTDAYRLRPDRSGYDNLVLAGDWTDCGINAGCIEAAAVSGLQAANALLGRPRWDRISGLLLR
jgi:uncharacterized protein with NAD-binding domain and iron-sulfur cluster